MSRRYELIDTVDNDCHDDGSHGEMQADADVRNADERRCGGNPRRWIVRPEGWSAEHFTGG